jgi:hypothetical protein
MTELVTVSVERMRRLATEQSCLEKCSSHTLVECGQDSGCAFRIGKVVYVVQRYRQFSGHGIAERQNYAVSFVPIRVLA